MAKQKQDKKVAINQFAIYDVDIFAAEQKIVEPAISQEMALKKANELFGSFFEGRKLSLAKYDRNNTIIIDYPNDILSTHDGVYLLRINNIKHKKLVKPAETTTNGIQDYEEITEDSNPYCYVVVDNRGNVPQMAIQKNSAFGDPNAVRKLLQENFNRQFVRDNIELELTISAKMRTSKIWEFCYAQCDKNGDAITRLSFVFPNQKKVAAGSRIQNPKGYIKQLAKLAKLTNAVKTCITMDYENADREAIEKNADDLAHIIRVCKNSSYHLHVYFRDYGLYRCDDLVRAMFPMEEKLLNAFRLNWSELEFNEGERYGLIYWCDFVNEQSKIYVDGKRVPFKTPHRNS